MNKQKQSDRIRNWREYNAALVERGSLTVWFEEDHIKQWCAQEKTGRRGASNTYLAVTIQRGLVIRAVFQLPLRATEGLLCSLVKLLGLELKTPDHSTFSRRGQGLAVSPDRRQLGVLAARGCGGPQCRDSWRSRRRLWSG